MNAAINTLTIALEILEINEPINRERGNVEQAELEAANAVEMREALAILRGEKSLATVV